MSESDWTMGRIRKVFVDRGYGFIDAGLGKDVFFHMKFLSKIEREFIREGVNVRFQLEENEDKLRARRVSLIGQERVV